MFFLKQGKSRIKKKAQNNTSYSQNSMQNFSRIQLTKHEEVKKSKRKTKQLVSKLATN